MFDFACIEDLVAGKSIETTGGGDDNVRALGLVPEEFRILGHGCTTIEGRDAHIWHVLGETRVLVLDLEGKFTCVASD